MANTTQHFHNDNPRLDRALQSIGTASSVSLVADKNRNGYRYYALKVRCSAQTDQPRCTTSQYLGQLTQTELDILQAAIMTSRRRPEPDSRIAFLEERIRQQRRFLRMLMPDLQQAARAAGYRMRGLRLMEVVYES